MFAKDVLCRAAVYPSCFREGRYDREAIVNLVPKDPDRRDFTLGHGLSFASKFLCANEEGVHNYGVKTETLGNERKAAASADPLSVKSLSHYIGFFNLFYEDVSGIVDPLHEISIYWLPENGLDEHFQFEMSFIGEKTIAKASIKQAIRTTRQKLLAVLSDPVPRPKDETATDEVQEFRDGLIAVMMAQTSNTVL